MPRAPARISSGGCGETFAGHRIVGDVRGVGMLAAVEFVADRDGQEAASIRP